MCMNRKHFVAKTVECVLRRFFVLFHSYATGRDYMPSISQIYVHPCEKVKGLFSTKVIFHSFFCLLFQFSYMTYLKWSIWILPICIGFESLVTSQWHFEKGISIKNRCCVSLAYAICLDDMGKTIVWGVVRVWGIGIKHYKLSKTCHHTQDGLS